MPQPPSTGNWEPQNLLGLEIWDSDPKASWGWKLVMRTPNPVSAGNWGSHKWELGMRILEPAGAGNWDLKSCQCGRCWTPKHSSVSDEE